MLTFDYVEEPSTYLRLSSSAASCHNFCGSVSTAAYRRSSIHSLSRFSAITSLLARDETSNLRQFPAVECWVLKRLLLEREGRFTTPLPFEAYRSLLNLGIRFGQENVMLERRLLFRAAPHRSGYRFALALRFADK
jgi:hypothetical protein